METPRSLADSKKMLKEKILSRCEHGNYLWINPDIEATVRCCNQSYVHSSMLAFYVLQTLVTTPAHQTLPLDVVLTMPTTKLWDVIQDDFLSCVSTEDLLQVLKRPTSIPSDNRLLFVRASVKSIVLRGHCKDLPASMFDMYVANLAMHAGVPVEILQQIESSGFPLHFPVTALSQAFMRTVCTFTSHADPRVVRYVAETYGHKTPFERHDVLDPVRVTQNQSTIYTLVTCGYQRVETPGELMTLIHNANTLLQSERGIFAYNSFLTWLKENISNYPGLCNHLNGLPPKSLELLEILVEHIGCTFTDTLVSDIIWSNSSWCVPMLLYLRSVRGKPFGDSGCLLGLDADPRVVTYLCSSTGVQPPFIYAEFPDVTEETDMIVQFNNDLRVHVYSDFLAARSPILKTLFEGGGFKRVLTDDGKKKVLTLETGLPEGLRDPKCAVKSWITFCYTGALEASVTINQVNDLKILAQYLQDDNCQDVANKWMEHEYMSNKEHYRGHRSDTDCPVCCHWYLVHG